MMKYTRRLMSPLALTALAATAFLGACRSDSKRTDSTALGADSTLNRDLALAGRDTNVQPQLKDVPANAPAEPKTSAPRKTTTPRPPAPKTNTPAPAPKTTTTASGNSVTTNPSAGSNPSSSGGGAVGMIPAGATITTNAASRICTNTNSVGDKVTATVGNAVTGSNGDVIPASAT